ncbi:CD209 antigen [Lingula anatina]|uniref:CD209 antigen n=1 Tax=Lingula anatina TaxID=7574 RepID=A0A1S3J7T9_LINAN|nr:CD209 antigen [Lingula anatina]|eukprot:XP_013405924.1 CD209 antigen [Lingula anatina]
MAIPNRRRFNICLLLFIYLHLSSARHGNSKSHTKHENKANSRFLSHTQKDQGSSDSQQSYLDLQKINLEEEPLKLKQFNFFETDGNAEIAGEPKNAIDTINNYKDRQCLIVEEVQSSVIQLLHTSYQYGKSIHTLEELLKKLQRELHRVKKFQQNIQKLKQQRQNDVGDTTYAEAQVASSVQTGRVSTQPMDSPQPADMEKKMLEKLEEKALNITDELHEYTNTKYHSLSKKVHHLEKRVEKDMKELAQKDQEVKTLMRKLHDKEQMLVAQEDTTKALQARMQWVEDAVFRMISKPQELQPVEPKKECPDGFFRYALSCYKFVNMTANWPNAEAHCQGLHPKSHLVGVETKEENEFILSYRKYNQAKWTSPWFWTGGTDKEKEGDWRWIGTGQKLTYTYWTPHEPNDHTGRQNCLYYTASGNQTWDDWNCENLYINFVCEIELEQNQ